MIRNPLHRRDLVQQVRAAILGIAGPRLTADQARRVSRGQEVIPPTQSDTDESTVHQWGMRYFSGDWGAYIAPTEEYFVDLADTNGLVITRDVYTGESGNIKYAAGATGGLFVLFSGRVYVSERRTVRLSIQCINSLWIGLDNATVVSSGNLGPNQHSDAVLDLAAGEHNIDVGVYAQSGTLHLRMLGDLAGQVDTMLPAPETDPPAAPTGLAATTDTQVDTGSKSVVFLTWDANTEDDIHSYSLYRKSSAGGTYEPVVNLAARPAGHESFSDVYVVTGEQYWYALRATDTVGNVSPIHEMATNPVTAGDTTPPGAPTGVGTNTGAIADGATTVFNDNIFEVEVTGTSPSNSDMAAVEISVTRGAYKNFATAWGQRELGSEIPTGPSEFFFHTIAIEPGSETVLYVWIDPKDRAGNRYSDSFTRAYGFRVELNRDVSVAKTHLYITPPANKNGWHNTSVNIDAEVDDAVAWIPSVFVFSIDGVDSSSFPSSPQLTRTAETDADGESIVGHFISGDGTNTSVPSAALLKIDKTAPSAPTALDASNVRSGIKLTWTPGSDALSGLQETVIYRNTANDSGAAKEIARLPADADQFVDTDELDTDTTYWYWAKHNDNADNLSAFSTGVSVKRLHPKALAFTNQISNPSFERLDPFEVNTFADWLNTGTPGIGTTVAGRHGDRYTGVSTATKVTQSRPLVGKYWMFSLLARSGSAGRKAQIALSFKDASGTELTSVTLSTPTLPTGGSFVRYSSDGTTPWVIGPAGSDAPNANEYSALATSVDVTIQGDASDVQVDAIMMQWVTTSDAGATWQSIETGDTAPTEFNDANVVAYDAVIAHIGRFGTVYAGNIVAGTLQGDGFALNLDTGDITITSGSLTMTADLFTVMQIINDTTDDAIALSSLGIQQTQDNGDVSRAQFVLQVPVTNPSGFGGLDDVVSGSVSVPAYPDYPAGGAFPLYVIAATLYQNEGANEVGYPIEQKDSPTDPGHGSYSITRATVAETSTINYSVYVEDGTHTVLSLIFVVGVAVDGYSI